MKSSDSYIVVIETDSSIFTSEKSKFLLVLGIQNQNLWLMHNLSKNIVLAYYTLKKTTSNHIIVDILYVEILKIKCDDRYLAFNLEWKRIYEIWFIQIPNLKL